MRPRHLALILVVVVLWGLNFTAIKIALRDIPPLMLCAIRFFLVSIPGVALVRRPRLPYWHIIAYGSVLFALQFGLMFTGMQVGVTPGIASIIMQTHVFFTGVLAAIFLGEKPAPLQLAGAALSFSGIGFVAVHVGGDITLGGLALIIAAAAAWGMGNVLARRFGRVNVIGLVVWSSLVAWPPLAAMSFALEGRERMIASLQHCSWSAALALLYISFPVTLVAFALWSRLLSIYPTVMVAPFTLAVPMVAMWISAIVVHEPISAWKIVAGALVMGGLCLNLCAARIARALGLRGEERLAAIRR